MYVRGMTLTMGRESLFTMSMLSVTPLIQEALVKKFKMDPDVGKFMDSDGCGDLCERINDTSLTLFLSTLH